MDVSFRTILILFYITSISFFTTASETPYYGMCANPTCSEPIGQGMAILRYSPGEHDRMKIDVKQVFDIYVKDYGEKKHLLGIMINGQKGYVPKNVVQEQRSFVKDLVPAVVEYMYTHTGNQNQGTNQLHVSMTRQEVIHHVTPDSYSHEQNYHSNIPSESYGYHSSSGWTGENSNIYASPHVHVISSHVEASVTSQTSNVAQRPNTWESTSHIYNSPENSASSYPSGVQQGTYQNTAHQQQYSDSTYTSGNQQQATYQNAAPEKYSQSAYPSEYQSTQHANKLQTSFSPQVQSNMQYAQNSQSNQMYASNTASNEAQNYAHNPQVASSHSSYATKVQYSPDGSVSAQYSSQYVDKASYEYMSSYASQNVRPQIDISGTIAALKAQGYDEGELIAYFHGEGANLYPSHSHSGQGTYGHSSQLGYSSSGAEMDQNYGHQHSSVPGHQHSSVPGYQHSSVPSQEEKLNVVVPGHQHSSVPGYQHSSVPSQEKKLNVDVPGHQHSSVPGYQHSSVPSQVASSEEKAEYPSSNNQFYSSSQIQQPVVKEFSQQTASEVQDNEEGDDSGEVSDNEAESETSEENNSKELPSSAVEDVPNSQHPGKQVNSPSPFPREALQSVVQKTVDSSQKSESNTQDISSETISESKVSKEYLQTTAHPDASQSNFIKDTQKTTAVPDVVVSDELSTNDKFKDTSIPDFVSSSNLAPNNTVEDKEETIEVIDVMIDDSTVGDTENDIDKSGLFFDNEETVHPENINETDTSLDKEQNNDLEKILNISELGEAEQNGYLNAYQIRNLKGEQEINDSQNPETSDEDGGNASSSEFDFYDYINNTIEVIRSFVDVVLSWIPDPLYSILMDLEDKGISPRVPVFTALSAVPSLILIIAFFCFQERSKERKLIAENTAQLAFAEKNVYTLSAEKNVLEEKLEKAEEELESCKTSLESERKFYDDLKAEVVNLNQELEKSNLELETRVLEIETLKEQEKEFVKLINVHEKVHLELNEEKNQLNNQLILQDETICQLNDQLQEKEKEIKELQDEKLRYSKANEVYEEKLTQLQQNCNQLLKEAEIWNLRVNELNTKLNEETEAKQQLEESLKTKDSEIESLTFLMESFKSFEELEDSDSDEYKSKKEKLQGLLKSANISISLERQEEENKFIMQKLAEEKNKILDMEVELLEAKSETDKLKLSYNQALQDKTEAQTKLTVLTNYFKDKEIQLQKQLGAQEVFREKREKDADSAERRIVLIEQENTSYKSQVASMKQEMEETERNLKSQIAAQEKKAHENWIAARAAERKLEDMKQEVTQLRQKLTLLERDQGNFINASRDDVIRPIPQRITGVNDETINSQDINNTMDEPPGMYRMPLPHMMLPDMPRDRPLPPLPLPPPPFEPPPMFAPPPFGPFPRDPMFNSEFRVTPPEFARGRASTPPRGRQSAVNDNDMGPRQSSPLGGELRESRNSTPPHSLPDFHDIPPPPRSFYPPHRFPFRPPFRREFGQGPPRPDYPGENPQSRGAQHASMPPDGWAPSNSRV